jgi:predicted NBD/HSP70 family sugar kinase
MLTGTNLKYTKAYNYRIVLETIRLHGPFSRAQVARGTSLTAQTVSNIVRELMDAGLVVEAGKRQNGRGAPATTLKTNPDSAFSVGLDFNRDHLTGVLLDFSGEVRRRVHHDLDLLAPEAALDLMHETAEALIDGHGAARDTLTGVGVGFPGPLDISEGNVAHSVVSPKKFAGWDHVSVARTLQERLSLPVFLENNATAAATGERWYGAGQEIDTFFYLHLGAGLGGGIVLDGSPFDGHSGNAGELGYLPALGSTGPGASDGPPAPPQTHAGERFHLPMLYQELRDAGFEATVPADLVAIYDDGPPPLLRAWLDAAGRELSHLLLSVEYLIDPEAVFMGGRLPDVIVHDLLQRLRETLPELRTVRKLTTPRLMKATAGIDAAVLGAGTLPFYKFFSPAPHLLLKQEQEDRSTAAASPSALFGAAS